MARHSSTVKRRQGQGGDDAMSTAKTFEGAGFLLYYHVISQNT
jgi:hypothetical protein